MSNFTALGSPGDTSSDPQPPQLSAPTIDAGQGSPPYALPTAVMGGIPTIQTDGPICGVLLAFFVASAAIHFTLYQRNKRRGHFFIFSSMLFGFSLMRTAGLAMRLLWAANLSNVRIGIAANILAQAGSIIVFVVNLFLTQRIVRGYHPDFGWSTAARVVFRSLVVCILSCLVMLVAATTQTFYTLDDSIRDKDHIVQLFAGTLLTVLAFLPVPTVIIAALAPRKHDVEKFGQGSWRTKLFLLTFASTLLTLGAGFRVGVNFGPRPASAPAWYHERTPFYIFNFVLDLIMSFVYIASAFYKRFHIPDGAKGPGSYMVVDTETDAKPGALSRSPSPDDSAPAPIVATYRAWPSSHDASSIKKPKSALKRYSVPASDPAYYAKGLPRHRDFEGPAPSRAASRAGSDTSDVEDLQSQIGGENAEAVLGVMLEQIAADKGGPYAGRWAAEGSRTTMVGSRSTTMAGSRATTMVNWSGSEDETENMDSDGSSRSGKQKAGAKIKWAS